MLRQILLLLNPLHVKDNSVRHKKIGLTDMDICIAKNSSFVQCFATRHLLSRFFSTKVVFFNKFYFTDKDEVLSHKFDLLK